MKITGTTTAPGFPWYGTGLTITNGAFAVLAHVEIEPRAKQGVLLVPREAVRTEGGRTRVLVVQEGRAQAVAIRLGIVAGSHAEVLGGLPVDSEVIVGSAAQEIAPGMQVRVMPSDAKPAS